MRLPPHGTTARYNHGGCRCDRCRARHAAYCRGWRRRRRAAERKAQKTREAELRALRERARVALELRARGELDGVEALLVTVWPRNERLLEARHVRTWAPEVRAEAVELFAAGWSLTAIERELGIAVGTVKPWLREAGVERNGTAARVTIANRTLVA